MSVSYGGVVANDGIDLSVEPGMIAGLIGPNGAGKTTFIDAVTGFTPISGGHIRLDGVDLTSASPARRARAGLGRTFQSLELFEELSVRDNLTVAAEQPRWWSLALDLVHPTRGDREVASAIGDVVELLDIAGILDARPSELSLGTRKLVAVARALASRPKVVLLDEPAAGLDTDESAEFGVRLKAICGRGTSIVLIDHDTELVMGCSDEVTVLDFGAVIAHGTAGEVRNDLRVVEAYLGSIEPSPGGRHG